MTIGTLDIIFFCIGVAASVPAWVSAWVTYRRTPWRKSEVGRHLMAYMLSIAVTFTVLTLSTVLADPRPLWFRVLQVASYLGTVAAVWWRCVIVWKLRPTAGGTHRAETANSAGEK
jgi:hypothetical protein